MKNIVSIFKSFFLGIFILFIFNTMAVGIDIYIPINLYTVIVVGIFGIPGLLLLIYFLLFIF